jgi:hypothetical protein
MIPLLLHHSKLRQLLDFVKGTTVEYHKIQTVFLRDPETNFKRLMEGKWALPEFEYLSGSQWYWTEKVDGTNIRVIWDGAKVCFRGKTDDASVPPFLLAKLAEMFTKERMTEVLGAGFHEPPFCLYGEGYGARIQKGGGNYIPDGVSFILFDVFGGGIWLERNNVVQIGDNLDVLVAPIIGQGTLMQAVEFARKGFTSDVACTEGVPAEGLVMRPMVELKNRRGHRIIAKIKAKDFAS